MATAAPANVKVPTPAEIAGDTALRWAWIAENLLIVDKGSEVRPLVPNRGQQLVTKATHIQESAGLPVRIILLKARQFGGSTGIQGDFFARCALLDHRQAFTAAHKAQATERLFAMSKGYYDRLPKNKQPRIDSKNGYKLAFSEPNGGGMTIATAGSPDAARSGTYQYAHCSEYAWWDSQLETMAAIDSAVPYRPGTMIVIESTANGMGDDFHQRWCDACTAYRQGDISGYIPVFVGWLQIEDYTLAVPAGYDWSACPPDVMEEEPALRAIGASDEQLYWRRKKIVGGFGGSVDMFHQEFPSTPSEAFLTSGRAVCPANVIAHHRTTCEQGRKARLVYDRQAHSGVRAVYDESLFPPFWRIWRPPQEDGDYAIAGDVAEGGLSDPNNPSSEPDRSGALVIERQTLMDCAEYISREEADIFGEELYKAHKWYNEGWVTPEANPAGMASLLVLKRLGCKRIMRRVAYIDKLSQQPQESEGWKTLLNNRENMLMELLSALRPAAGGSYEGQMIVRSSAFLDELETFIRLATGRMQHMLGKHDDLIFARAIVYQVHVQCPRTVVRKKWKPPVPRRDLAALAMVNAIDPGPRNWRRGGRGGPEESR
jgi:hypothetical protein